LNRFLECGKLLNGGMRRVDEDDLAAPDFAPVSRLVPQKFLPDLKAHRAGFSDPFGQPSDDMRGGCCWVGSIIHWAAVLPIGQSWWTLRHREEGAFAAFLRNVSSAM
jgi:hypothetical protein